jgi:AAA ATPase domain
VADWQTWTVPQDLAQLSVAVATAFVASDGEPAAFATAAEALAATEALRRAQPDAVIAIHVADREGPGAARARRLREIGRRGQTLVSAAAAALPAAEGLPLHDLGIHRLRDLSLPERVFALGTPGDEPLNSLDATPNNLPSRPTTFVGREAELADLHDRLAQARLITIIGPGGSGKTRLAAQLAADEAGPRPDGAWWVELGDVADPGQVAQAVAAALGVLVDPAQGTVEQLRAQLASRRLLLCLDNC